MQGHASSGLFMSPSPECQWGVIRGVGAAGGGVGGSCAFIVRANFPMYPNNKTNGKLLAGKKNSAQGEEVGRS